MVEPSFSSCVRVERPRAEEDGLTAVMAEGF